MNSSGTSGQCYNETQEFTPNYYSEFLHSHLQASLMRLAFGSPAVYVWVYSESGIFQVSYNANQSHLKQENEKEMSTKLFERRLLRARW